MSLQKNNQSPLKTRPQLIAVASLMITFGYTAWQLSDHGPRDFRTSKSSMFSAEQGEASEPSSESGVVTSHDGGFAFTQKAAPVLDVHSHVQGSSASAVSNVQSKQPAGVNAELVDDGPREIVMEPAAATVTLNGISRDLEPNAIGCFPRMLIAAEGSASVLVSYPNARLGDQLVIQCEDGGSIDHGPSVKRAELDAAGRVAFQFSAGAPEGIYRVLLRWGLDEKHLEFWAGPELALKPVPSKN